MDMSKAIAEEFARPATVRNWALVGPLLLSIGCHFDPSVSPPDLGVADGGNQIADAAVPGDASGQSDASRTDAMKVPTLTFQRSADTPQEGGDGGELFEDACPAGQVLIGISGEYNEDDEYLGRISAHCGRVTLISDGAGGYDIAFAPGQELAGRGDGGGTPWTRECASGDVMIGFDGRAGVLIDRLFVRCADFTVSGELGSLVFTTGAPYELALVGGNGGAPFPSRDCPTDEVATVTHIRAGLAIDAFGLGCAVPSVN